MSLISVLLPCHNSALWLQDAIESVCRQTVHDLEIFVYDDGSSDGSAAIIRRLAASDARIKPMGDIVNRGIVHALNTMFKGASGAYVARMDADDVCLPHRFEQQLYFIESGSVDLCGTWFQEFGNGIPRTVRWHHKPDELRAAMLFQNTICHPTVMARREVFESFTYRENYNLAEDYDLYVRALGRFRLANVPATLLRYRRHKEQATHARRAKMEEVTRRIRLRALAAQGIEASPEEQRIHNLIRAPQSIRSMEDFERIETWLLKLVGCFEVPEAQRTIASQWTRAAVRAAPLGWGMWRRYRNSPLRRLLDNRPMAASIDMAVLATLRLDYRSHAFETLRRLGISV